MRAGQRAGAQVERGGRSEGFPKESPVQKTLCAAFCRLSDHIWRLWVLKRRWDIQSGDINMILEDNRRFSGCSSESEMEDPRCRQAKALRA